MRLSLILVGVVLLLPSATLFAWEPAVVYDHGYARPLRTTPPIIGYVPRGWHVFVPSYHVYIPPPRYVYTQPVWRRHEYREYWRETDTRLIYVDPPPHRVYSPRHCRCRE